MIRRSARSLLSLSAAGVLVMIAACGDNTASEGASTSSGDDGGTTNGDAASTDDGASTADAAPASRNSACTPLSQQNGNAVSTSYGRLDGTLVYVVGIGQSRSCNG